MEKQPDKNNPFKKLPSYKAPNHIWDKIRKNLDEPEEMVPLKDRLRELPVYTAPATAWIKVGEKLGHTPVRQIRTSYRKWWGAAAAVLLLIGFLGWQFLHNTTGVRVEYTQWEEVLEEDWQLEENNGNDPFALVTSFCQQKQYICDTPEFQNLKAELDELNLACESLREAIGQYNDEPAMIAQLTDIEMERTQVLKKIMTYL